MGPAGLIRVSLLLLISSLSVCTTSGPIGTSEIDCGKDSNKHLGYVKEGFEGVVELVTVIQAGTNLVLGTQDFPAHSEYLELNFTPGETSATVRIKKPLDANALKNSGGVLYYNFQCQDSKFINRRRLTVNDTNDSSPVFTQESYNATISEVTEVGNWVLKVTAEDMDLSPEYNTVTYSIVPMSEDFLVNSTGFIILNRRLNFNVSPKYKFTMLALDNGGLNDTATVLINVKDVDNRNPYFSNNTYQAVIPENKTGSFQTIQPEAIKAQDGDSGINMTVTYSIGSVLPKEYEGHFSIDENSGVISVQTSFDREQMSSNNVLINIKAAQTDDSLKTADAVVLVTVADINDSPPVFDQDSYSVTLLENSPNNSTVFKVIVTDADEGGFVGTLKISPESAPFTIDDDGTVRVKDSAALDRETNAKITFQIEATDTDSKTVAKEVLVILEDENDNSPSFTSNMYNGHVFANQTVGMLLVQVMAVDQDAGENGQIKYNIDFGNNEGYFSIDEETGNITLAKQIPLQENKILEFPLYVTASDGGRIPRSSSVQVKILAPGHSRPQFLQKVYWGTIEEEQIAGTHVLKISFLALESDTVTLHVDTEAEKFAINPNGELSTQTKLDYDEAPHNYSVRISITDGVHTDQAVVEVQVTDINDNSPVFNSMPGEVSVSENAEEGSNVTAVSATDKDSGANGEIRYSLTGGEDRFVVHPESGLVTLAAGLDREVKAQYQLQVVAEDQGHPANTATATLLIKVTDVNDNMPEFSQATYQLQVPENQPIDTSLLTLSATDLDEGDNKKVSYRIVHVDPSSGQDIFELDANLGTLKLAQLLLDYSVVKEYRLVVEASDGGTPSLVRNTSVVVKVTDVNNNPPEFDKGSYNLTIFENLANGVILLTVKVKDKDEGGFNGTLKVLPDTAPFSISSDGTITVRDTTALDRERTGTITFQVEATEATPPNHIVTANVSVTLLDENDNSPKFLQSHYENILNSSQTEGMSVVTVEAVDGDADINGQIKYSIDFGNEQEYFSIDNNNGAITLVKIIPVEAHETKEFLFVVTATDGGVVPRSTSVTVQINAVGDTKLHFNQNIYHVTTEEEIDPGTVIVKVGFFATDMTKVTLEVKSEEHKEIFAINQNGEFSIKKKLDYDEAPHSYSVNISITDGVHTDQAVVEVQVTDINDNSPVFNSMPGEVSVPEDAKERFSVTTVSATDKDSGANGGIRYSLTGGEARFLVHPESGLVTLAAGLDREVKAQYQLQVVAEDQGHPAKTATATLLIKVTDVNDNTPEFAQAEYQLQVPENQPIDTNLLTLSATDLDEGKNAKVSYNIIYVSPSSGQDIFELDANLGTLKLAQLLLDYSEVKEYRLVVEASDGGTPSLVGNTSVVVKVMDVNNNPPEFDKESYDLDVSENLASGATILTMKVTDRDEGGFSNGHFNYSSESFEINNQGVVSLRKDVTLDRETKDSYTIQVVAVDQPSGGLSATAVINISILDYNDNAPQFPTIPEQFEIREGDYSEERPADIINMNPTDPDLGPNGEVTIAIFPTNPLFRFREDGTLMAVGSLDRESRDTHELVVTASDNGNPQRQNITTVTVVVTDINDNKPEFSSSSYISNILLKDVLPGKLVLTLEATDRDLGSNSLITYSFLGGGSPYLNLDSTTGAIKFTSKVTDVTEDTMLDLTATAQDHGEPPLSATATVIINIKAVAIPEVVTFLSSYYNFSLPENQPAGVTVGKVQASSGSDLYIISYSLRNHNDRFSVNTDGTLHTKDPLDKELQGLYMLEVEAEDTRMPPTSAVAIVTVWVLDVNEPPQFHTNQYQASVFSIAPYKTPVVTVMASDPDVGDGGLLTYSLVNQSRHFDVDSSSGLVYVVSVADLAGTQATVVVKVSDPKGLEAVTNVEVAVNGTGDSRDVVVISIEHPANSVEEQINGVESALTSVLGWTVHILAVRSDGGLESRSSRETTRTLVSFISLVGDNVVPSKQVIEKLKSHSDALHSALNRVFGEDVNVDVEEPESGGNNGDNGDSEDGADGEDGGSSSQTVVIVLGVLLGLCLLLLIVTAALLISVHRKKKRSRQYGNSEVRQLDNKNWVQKNPEMSEWERQQVGSRRSASSSSSSKSSKVEQELKGQQQLKNTSFSSQSQEVTVLPSAQPENVIFMDINSSPTTRHELSKC